MRLIINDIPDVRARESALQATIDASRPQQQSLQESMDTMTLARDRLAKDKRGLEAEVDALRGTVARLEAKEETSAEGRAEVDKELKEGKIKTAELEQEREDMLEEMRMLKLDLESSKRKEAQFEIDIQEMEVIIDAAQARDEVSLEERRKLIDLGKKRRRAG
jgi:chromosome segregation ATPase